MKQTEKPPLTDTDKMPFGIHKNMPLGNVPAKYMIYIYNKFTLSKQLKKYIADNMDQIKAEANNFLRR